MPQENIYLDAFNLKPAQAIEYMRGKGYAVSWNWYDTWREAHAKAFTVAKATRMDILQDIREEVDRAVAEGISFQKFKNELTPRLKAKGWWGKMRAGDVPGGAPAGVDPDQEVQLGSPRRLKTIFRANTQSAYMAGRYHGMMEVTDTRPWWQYLAVIDKKTRTDHRRLNEKVYRHDDPVWGTIFPPRGFGCRCRTRSLSDRQLQRYGYEPGTAEVIEKEVPIGLHEEQRWVKVRGVKTIGKDGLPVESWTDPGWDTIPGREAWQPNLDKYDYPVARRYVEGAVTGPDFERFVSAGGAAKGAYPVAVIDRSYQALIGASSQTVLLSDDTLSKQVQQHPEIRLSEYALLPNVVESAQLVVKSGDERLLFVRKGKEIYRAVVKAAAEGRELYLVSYHKVNERTAKQARNRGEIIKDEWQ